MLNKLMTINNKSSRSPVTTGLSRNTLKSTAKVGGEVSSSNKSNLQLGSLQNYNSMTFAMSNRPVQNTNQSNLMATQNMGSTSMAHYNK